MIHNEAREENTELKMSPEKMGSERKLKVGTVLADDEAKRPEPEGSRFHDPSIGSDCPLKSPQRTQSLPRRRRPMRTGSESVDLETVARVLRENSNDRIPSHARHSSHSHRRILPRRAKSASGDLYKPAHRCLVPCRSCIAAPEDRRKGISRQVSFGASSYGEIPRAATKEKNVMWYDESELKDLRKQVKKLAKKGLKDETEDCFRGLEPYVQQFQERKSGGGAPTEQQTYNRMLLELIKLEGQEEKQESEALKVAARELVRRISDRGARAAAQDEAEARVIYLESMDAEQVSKSFKPTPLTLARRE